MVINRWFPTAAALTAAIAIGAPGVQAQVTTGTIAGTVTDESGQPVAAAQVQIINRQTGATRGAITRDDGRYSAAGLEVGGGYAVITRRIGYAPTTFEGVRVTLGQTTRVDAQLRRQAAQLSTVAVTAAATTAQINPSKTGVGTTIGDSALRRLPNLGRNFTDIVQLTPQISSAGPGNSAGGVNNRFNSIQIDGAFASDAFGLGSTGQTGGQAGGRPVSILAVKEYQVLLAPFDVRQGTFAGALINAVTQSGTNEFRGTAEIIGRNESLTRSQDYLADYQNYQYAAAIGGPIIKNKAFFFVNADFQRQQRVATGPFQGSRDQTVPDSAIARAQSLLQGYGLPAGGGGQVQNENPLGNFFGRLDANLSQNHRFVGTYRFASADQDNFGRGLPNAARPNFPLSSYQYFFRSKTNNGGAQLFSNWANGISNELIVGYTTVRDRRRGTTPSPAINVVTNRLGATGSAQIQAGVEGPSQANELDQDFLDITNNLTIPLGSHKLTLGTQNRLFKFRNLFGNNALGNWTFNSLDSLSRGIPASYTIAVPAPGDQNAGAAAFNVGSYSLYLQDEWTVNDRLTLTAGVRGEMLSISDQPPYNRALDSVYTPLVGRAVRTDGGPDRISQFSPRLGFNWDVTGDAMNQLRGGVGVFVGNPAYVWLSNAYTNSGLSGFSSLTCNNNAATTAPPAFNAAAVASPPAQCRSTSTAPGASPALGGTINLTNPDYRNPQQFKASLGFDRRVSENWVATVEALYTRAMNNPFYLNLALPNERPTGVDATGRVLYGTFANNGARPAFVGGRQLVLDLQNQSRDYSYNLTGQLQRTFANRYSALLAYTYSQARDIGTPTNSVAASNYQLFRSVKDTLTKLPLGRSVFEQPHRVVASVSYALPTSTDISFIYTGQSGQVFDFGYAGSGNLGDLNADGQRNDLLYVPTSATDPNQIRFDGGTGTAAEQSARVAEQQAGFEQFINSVACLRNSRGRIMERNSCRSPWQNVVNVRLQQGLKTIGTQRATFNVEVFNFLNLLNKDWGQQWFPGTGGGTTASVLTEVRKVRADGTALANNVLDPTARGVYQFDSRTQRWNADNIASNYQIQLSVRYSF